MDPQANAAWLRETLVRAVAHLEHCVDACALSDGAKESMRATLADARQAIGGEARAAAPGAADVNEANAKMFGQIVEAREVAECAPDETLVEAIERLRKEREATESLVERIAEETEKLGRPHGHDVMTWIKGLAAPAPSAVTEPAVAMVVAERAKQRARWPDAHDDGHFDGEIAVAASDLLAAYCRHLRGFPSYFAGTWGLVAKNEDQMDRLRIAGALVVAEMQRLLRAPQPAPAGESQP